MDLVKCMGADIPSFEAAALDDLMRISGKPFVLREDMETAEGRSFRVERNHVVELKLWNSKVRELPDTIVNLAALKKLDLSGNRMPSVNPCIGKLTALEELDLSDNKITALPDELCRLKRLKKLDADRKSVV